MLWLNGGPGCSSFLGMLQEIGPFVMENNAQNFTKNEYAWNKKLNLLFLESPSGVGFSENYEDKWNYNDDTTALDNYNALVKFFEEFTTLKTKDFYIAGESYAGMYVPYLAYTIHTKNPTASLKINLKGN